MSRQELLSPLPGFALGSEAQKKPSTTGGEGMQLPEDDQELSELELATHASSFSDSTASSESSSGHPGLCANFLTALQKFTLGLPLEKSDKCVRCLNRYKQGSSNAKEHGGSLEYSEELHDVVYVCAEGHSWSADMKKVRRDRWCATCNKQQRCEKKAKQREESETMGQALLEEQQKLFHEAAGNFKG